MSVSINRNSSYEVKCEVSCSLTGYIRTFLFDLLPMLVLYMHFYDLILIERLRHVQNHVKAALHNFHNSFKGQECLRMMNVSDEKEKAFKNLV